MRSNHTRSVYCEDSDPVRESGGSHTTLNHLAFFIGFILPPRPHPAARPEDTSPSDSGYSALSCNDKQRTHLPLSSLKGTTTTEVVGWSVVVRTCGRSCRSPRCPGPAMEEAGPTLTPARGTPRRPSNPDRGTRRQRRRSGPNLREVIDVIDVVQSVRVRRYHLSHSSHRDQMR